jgi:purine-binding chemotaxis protein CheW
MSKRTEKELPSQRIEKIAETKEDTAPYEEDLYEREEPKEEALHLIVFRLAREWYGVEITKVKEIIKAGKITYLPSSPESIAGIVNLRGNILSITDLKTIFSLPYEESSEKARIIAIESGVFETGLLVDEVVESIEVPVRKIEPPLLSIPEERREYVEGQCHVNNKLIALISVEKVLENKV